MTTSQPCDALAARALAKIASCTDAEQLKAMAANANASGYADVERAARLRLYSILPSAEPGTLEFDVWQSIYSLEDTLTQERGKTLRLARTRQKIARDGEQRTVEALVTGGQSSGFDMLIARDMAHLTFEAVALRHPERFSGDVLTRAAARLTHAAASQS